MFCFFLFFSYSMTTLLADHDYTVCINLATFGPFIRVNGTQHTSVTNSCMGLMHGTTTAAHFCSKVISQPVITCRHDLAYGYL